MALRLGLPAKLANTDANDTRYDFRNLVVCNNDGSPRGGITSPVGTALISTHSTMAVAVAPFSAVAVRDGGVVLLANDGSTDVAIATAPVSNSRIDLICARQDDASSTVSVPDADNNAKLYAVTGTAASSPSPPALPAGSVLLGQITIPAGVTATNAVGVIVSQSPTFTASANGIVPFPSLAWLNSWTNACQGQFASIYVGASVIGLYQWNGSAWIAQPGPSDVGLVPIVPTSVVGTGVTVGANGKVTLTAAGSISLNGVFSSLYDNYKIILDISAVSAADTINLRLRAAGTDDASSNYSAQETASTSSSVTATTSVAANVMPVSLSATAMHTVVMDVIAPNLPRLTKIMAESTDITSFSSSTGISSGTFRGGNGTNTVFDGITFIPSASTTVTGTLRVYGYNNN